MAVVSPHSVWLDMKHAIRQWRLMPGFALVVVVTLALGIGVNTAIFSLLNALLLRPLAVEDNAHLLALYRNGNRPCSYLDFLDFQKNSRQFAGLAAAATNEMALDAAGQSSVVLAELTSFNYAPVLGVTTTVGRWFGPGDESSKDQFPVVISYRIWQSRFGGHPEAIGQKVRIESQWYTIAGVASKEFQGIAAPIVTDAWVPLERYAQHNEFAAHLRNDRLGGRVLVFGRLRHGGSLAQAGGELQALDSERRRSNPSSSLTQSGLLQLEPVRGTADPGNRRPITQLLLFLSILAALVFATSCANVSNLFLTRAIARRHELSIRLAIGASRPRIFQTLSIEPLLLSLLGGVAGLLAAYATNRFLESRIAAAPVPEALNLGVTVDLRVLSFALVTSFAAALLCGLLPAWRASNAGSAQSLRARRSFSLRNLSVIAQVAFSLVLLVAAGLFMRALQNADALRPGFETDHLLTARVFISEPGLNKTAAAEIYAHVLNRVRSWPGVRGVTLTYDSPAITMQECVVAEGSTGAVLASQNVVEHTYFATFGIPIVQGRDFSETDRPETPDVAIVNETLARRYWPQQDAVGKRLRFGKGCDKGEGSVAQIVGVARNAQYASLQKDSRPFLFLPFEQRYTGYIALAIRTTGNPQTAARSLLRQLHGIDPRLRIYEIDTLANQLNQSLWQIRWEASLLSALGGLGLIVASIGLFGVVSFVTRQRTKEFGIRMALGARGADITRLIAATSLSLTAVGILLGFVLSLAFSRLPQSLLYGVSAFDASSFAGAALIWLAVSLAASWPSVRKATTLDPSVTLRNE